MFFSSSGTKAGKEILDGFYIFFEDRMLDCNQYVIVNEDMDEIGLFDAGNGLSLRGLFEGMKKFDLDYKKITKVFITHEHVDHVLGLYALMEVMKDEPPEIFAFGETAKILQSGDEARIFPGNLGIRPSMFGIRIVPLHISDLQEGQKVNFSSKFSFNIIYTPGHSLGSISYYEPTKRILIPGDLIFAGGNIGRFDFPGSSLKALQNSIKYIVDNLDVKYLLPGHMNISDDGNRQIELSYRMAQSMF